MATLRTTGLLLIFTLVLFGALRPVGVRAETGDAAGAPEALVPAPRDHPVLDPGDHRPSPGAQGALGLPHLPAAEVGPTGSARLGLLAEAYSGRDFLIAGHRQSRTAATLSLGYTVLPWLELYAATGVASSGTTSQPELLQVLGDSALGAKAVRGLGGGLSLGTDLRLLAGPGVGSQTLGTVAIAPRLLLTFDGREAGGEAPLRFHLMAGARAALAGDDDVAELSAYEAFALGIQEGTGVLAGAGVEVSLPWVTPFLSWRMDAPLDAAAAEPAHVLGLGGRFTAVAGLSLTLAVDLGVAGGTPEAGGPVVPPWSALLGVAYTFAPAPPPPRPVVITEPVPVERGRLAGVVRSGEDGRPLAGALVWVEVEDARPAATDAEGRFRTHGLPPGQAPVTVHAPGHEPLRVTALVRETGETELALTLLPSEAAPAQVAGAQGATPAVLAARDASPVAAAAPRPRAPRDVTLEGDRLELARPVRFEPGGAELLAESRGLLDQVAAAVRHFGLRRIRIEAHTDGEGADEANLALSRARAEAVRRHLVEAGVEAAGLEAVGYGETRPLAPNLTRRGRAMNRRVEFHVLERAR